MLVNIYHGNTQTAARDYFRAIFAILRADVSDTSGCLGYLLVRVIACVVYQ